MERRSRSSVLFAATGVCLLLASGCSRSPLAVLGPNTPPEIEIVDARARGSVGVRVRWAARDPDGKVKLSRWAITPWDTPVESMSGTTTSAEECLLPRDPNAAASSRASTREPERFCVWAVDDRGATSAPATLAIFANNVAPNVWITGPIPSVFLRAQIPSTVCITWTGNDPDGIFTTKPVKYKYRILDLDDPSNQGYLSNPDALRSDAVASNWAYWDSTSADTESVTFTNLTPGKGYLFAVTGFDEAGDYDPVFGLDKNMLTMTANLPDYLGPMMALASTSVRHQYSGGGWFDTPARRVDAEVAAGEPVRVEWSAIPGAGHAITGYRWVLDPVSLTDETPRSGPNDVRHWSTLSMLATDATIGPFSPSGHKREEHLLYIESRSSAGCVVPGSEVRSLAIVHLVVVRPTQQRELLIVDDTRLSPDRTGGPAGCPALQTTPWPSAAELDTFLYARGGVPWRCTVNPTTGVTSIPGLFAGYAFDTLGTRGVLSGQQYEIVPGQLQQRGTIPLSKLADYRHVIWLTDQNGVLYTNPPNDGFNPTTAMRYTSQFEREVLSAYVRMGGKLWVVGVTATASLLPFDRPQNNAGATTRFSSAPQFAEIAPGRFTWETLKLRSEISTTQAAQGTRSLGRFGTSPGAYAAFPELLQSRTAGTDPMPPTRTASQTGLFYSSVRRTEFLSQPNVILEDVDPDPGVVDEQSVLDSLYIVQGSQVPAGTENFAMTRYHGGDGEVVWSGFDIWSFQRTQCIAVVDAVLQGIWGLPRAPIARAPAGAPVASGSPARPASPAAVWRRAPVVPR